MTDPDFDAAAWVALAAPAMGLTVPDDWRAATERNLALLARAAALVAAAPPVSREGEHAAIFTPGGVEE